MDHSILRRKNRWGLTVLFGALSIVLAPFLGLTLFIPHLLTAAPLAIVALLGYVGPVSACFCGAVLCALCGLVFSEWGLGIWGVACAALFIVPLAVFSAVAVERKMDFWLASAAGAAVMFISSCLTIGMIGLLAGTDVVSALVQAMRGVLEAAPGMSDALLDLLSQTGALTQGLGASLDTAGRAQLMGRVMNAMDSLLRLEIPMQLSTGALAAGVMGQAILRKSLLARGEKAEFPPLRTWHVPKGWGRILGGTLLALYVLMQLMPRQTRGTFYIFSGLFEQVFVLQGIAALCWLLHARGSGKGVQRLVFILGYFLLTTPALIVGIADQAFDPTHRREKIETEDKYNPFDPRSGEES